MTDVGRIMEHMSEQTSPTSAVPAWTLGWRLQRALAHVGMGTSDMADELGVARSTISRWVNDHGAPPKAAYVKQWALRCGVPYVWLDTGEVPQDGPDGTPTLGSPPGAWNEDRAAEVIPLRHAA